MGLGVTRMTAIVWANPGSSSQQKGWPPADESTRELDQCGFQTAGWVCVQAWLFCASRRGFDFCAYASRRLVPATP